MRSRYLDNVSRMTTAGLNLLISDKPDVERDALADVFAARGGEVHRIGRFWDPPRFEPQTIRVYGADSFCLVLQQKLGFELCSPEDDLIQEVSPPFLRRTLARSTLAAAARMIFPVFVKPTVPKQFRGAVYASYDSLADECRGLTSDAAVFVSEPVKLAAEVRSFVLDGTVLDAAQYEGEADLDAAIAFLNSLIPTVKLPRAVVIDAGFIVGRGWGVIEFNAAWGAGLNGCNPKKVLPAVLAASGPQTT